MAWYGTFSPWARSPLQRLAGAPALLRRHCALFSLLAIVVCAFIGETSEVIGVAAGGATPLELEGAAAEVAASCASRTAQLEEMDDLADDTDGELEGSVAVQLLQMGGAVPQAPNRSSRPPAIHVPAASLLASTLPARDLPAAPLVALPVASLLQTSASAAAEALARWKNAKSATYFAHVMFLGGSWISFILVAVNVILAVAISGWMCCRPKLRDTFPVVPLITLTVALLTAAACWLEYVLLDGRLELVHIPKNAGSNMESIGLHGYILWGSKNVPLLGSQLMEDGSWCSRWHVPPSLLEGTNPYKRATGFCAVKHPYDRAVSEYTYLLDTTYGRRFYELYNNGLYDQTPCSELGLNQFVQTTLRLYLNGSKYIDDCHHVAQVDYIWDASGYQWCTEVMRLDTLTPSFAKLMREHGYMIVRPEESVYSSADHCPGISTANLTKETRVLLDQVYAEDFRRLDFETY